MIAVAGHPCRIRLVPHSGGPRRTSEGRVRKAPEGPTPLLCGALAHHFDRVSDIQVQSKLDPPTPNLIQIPRPDVLVSI